MTYYHLILAILVPIVWGLNFIFIKLALFHFPPVFLCAIRFLLTSIPAIFFVKGPDVPLKWLMLYSLFMFTLQFTLVFMGMHAGMQPGLTSLIMQIQLFFSFFLAILFLGEKLMPWHIVGALVSFAGIGIVWNNLAGQTSTLGFFFVISAAMAWAIGNLITKKIGQVNVFGLVVWGGFFAFPPLLLSSLVVEGFEQIAEITQHLSWSAVSSVLYIVYVSTWLGYCAWNRLLAKYPVATVTPFTLLVPIFGMVASTIIFDEPLETWKICAGLLVMLGLCINLLGSKILALSRKGC